MKPHRLDAAPQLNREKPAIPDVDGSDDPSQSGVRYLVDPARVEPPPVASTSPVTVVFRGVFPMERLVQLIRRRAEEAASKTPVRVEVEPLPDSQQWRVSVHTAHGEFAASEAGPFLAVTRAFALLA
jgi:hypothetical protein